MKFNWNQKVKLIRESVIFGWSIEDGRIVIMPDRGGNLYHVLVNDFIIEISPDNCLEERLIYPRRMYSTEESKELVNRLNNSEPTAIQKLGAKIYSWGQR